MKHNVSTTKVGPRQILAWILTTAITLSGMPILPAFAQSNPDTVAPPQEEPRKAHKRMSLAELRKPIIFEHKFTDKPSDEEFYQSRVFLEPLVPTDARIDLDENKTLAAAVLSYKQRKDPQDISAFTKFLAAHPKSRWSAALQMNLGTKQFNAGYLSDALKYWTSAWEKSKNLSERNQKIVADEAISRLVQLEGHLGLMDNLSRHMDEIRNRPMFGSAALRVKESQDGLWGMTHHPELAFKCGPCAVNTLVQLLLPKKAGFTSEVSQKAQSTKNGTNLAQVAAWAKEAGLDFQMAKRSPGAKVILPSIMHWRLGHFAALTKSQNGAYCIEDPTYGEQGQRWISPKALEAETDGYFLVPTGALPTGWQTVQKKEAEGVWGKAQAQKRNQGKTQKFPKTFICPDGKCNEQGMARATAFSMNASLAINDTPLGYQPPAGPSMDMEAAYTHGFETQLQGLTFTNLGYDWSINWVSYLTVDTTSVPGTTIVTVRVRGGGSEVYSSTTSTFGYDQTSQATIKQVSGTWERDLPDGSIEIFGTVDSTNGIHFMNSVVDPQGNAATISYNGNFRVNSVTDACGNAATTFAYVTQSGSTSDPGYYKIASITDGFSRTATFTYDSSVTRLTSITDAVGNVSKFFYDANSSFVNMMTTPYGSTRFEQYTPQGDFVFPAVGLKTTNPDGTTTVLENWIAVLKNGSSKQTTSSYFWDREATSLYPNDPVNRNYSHCETTRWLYDTDGKQESPLMNWVHQPLEAPVVYWHTGETSQNVVTTSTIIKPSQIMQQLRPLVNTATVGGPCSKGNTLKITMNDDALPEGAWSASYVVGASSSKTICATGLADAFNNDPIFQSAGISASAASDTVTITSNFTNKLDNTKFANDSTGGESISFANGPNLVKFYELSSVTAGDAYVLTVTDSGLPGGQQTFNYTAVSGDTTTTVAQTLAVAANANQYLQAQGISAVWTRIFYDATSNAHDMPGDNTNPRLALRSDSANTTTYSLTKNAGAVTQTTSTWGLVQASNFEYNNPGHVKKAADAVGRFFNLDYYSNNINLRFIKERDGVDNFELGFWEYNDSNAPYRPSRFYDGSGRQTNYTYESNFGELATVTDADSKVTTLSYDGGGYLTQINGPLTGSQDITTFTFFSYGPVHTITDSEGYTLTYAYDNLNRLTSTTYPDSTVEKTIYDRMDAVMQSDRLGRWTQFSYDSIDQLSFQIDPLGRKTSYCWCDCGALAKLTDAAGHVTKWHHDLQGRIIQKVYDDGTHYDYAYDSSGRLQSVSDAFSPTPQSTLFTYNLDNSTVVKRYANAVNATSQVVSTYDPLFPRLSTVSNGWGKYTYAYNAYIVVSGSSAPGVTTTGGGRISSITNDVISNSAISYTYDVLGRTTNCSINGSANSTTWTYDAMSRITEEVNSLCPSTTKFKYHYVDESPTTDKGTTRLSQIEYPATGNKQTANFTYLPNVCDQRLEQIKNLDPSSSLLSQFNCAYNPAGEIKQWQQQQNSTNTHLELGYDSASQLTTAVTGNNSSKTQGGSQFNAYISGTPQKNDIVSIIAYDASLTGTMPVGQETASYTVSNGDTASVIASNLVSNGSKTGINDVMGSNLGISATASGSVITIKTSPNYATQFTSGVTGTTPTTTISMSESSPILNMTKQIYYDYDCAGNRTTVQGDSTGSFGSPPLNTDATSYSYNSLNQLTASAAGGAVRFQGTTTNPIKSAVVNVSTTATIGGSVGSNNTLYFCVHDASLSQAQIISVAVTVGQSTTTIATNLKNAINADSTLSAMGITATSSTNVVTVTCSTSSNPTAFTASVSAPGNETITLASSRYGTALVSPANAFVAKPQLASGANTAKVVALSGGGTSGGSGTSYPVTVNSVTAKTLTYDADGNMTSDGTNTYSWDAENRLLQITYPGSNNNTQFVYDPFGLCVKMEERTSGSLTSTKQFVWCGSRRCEERDASSTLVSQFFRLGQRTSGTDYFYTLDHLGSVREMINRSSGAIAAQYKYDPYGVKTVIGTETVASDFQYAGYYMHTRSGLNLPVFRAYSSSQARWLTRDPLGEIVGEVGGDNLYAYITNDPISGVDPFGLHKGIWYVAPVFYPGAQGRVNETHLLRNIRKMDYDGRFETCLDKFDQDIDACIDKHAPKGKILCEHDISNCAGLALFHLLSCIKNNGGDPIAIWNRSRSDTRPGWLMNNGINPIMDAVTDFLKDQRSGR